MRLMLALLAALFAALYVTAQPVAVVAPAAEPDPPKVQLPPFQPVNIAKFDPEAVKTKNHPWHVTLVKAPESWAKNPAARGKGIRVAVLDTGVQADHPGFNGKIVGQYDAIRKREGSAVDKHGHGTHCAGIVHSIVPEAELVAIKVLGDDGSGSVSDIAHGIDVAVTQFRCDVISMSLGGPTTDRWQEPAIKRAVAAGAVVICAAGNDGGGPGRDTEGYPARYPDAVSVGACDKDRKLAPFSSWGPTVFTVDPGVDVLSLLPGTKEGEMSGTSMACPVEAGKCASWIASNGVPKTRERRDLYRASVLKASPFAERTNARGHGLYTLDRVTGEVTPPTPTPAPNPGEKVYTVSLADLQRQGYTSIRIDLGAGVTTGSPIPVSTPLAPAVYQSNTVPQYQPATVYQSVPQYSGGCPGGVCPVPSSPPLPLFRRVWR